MEMKEVVSSNVHSVGFEVTNLELKTGTLQVRFRGGSLYKYYDVPTEVYEAMLVAQSKGKYLNEIVKAKKFRYERIKEEVSKGKESGDGKVEQSSKD